MASYPGILIGSDSDLSGEILAEATRSELQKYAVPADLVLYEKQADQYRNVQAYAAAAAAMQARGVVGVGWYVTDNSIEAWQLIKRMPECFVVRAPAKKAVSTSDGREDAWQYISNEYSSAERNPAEQAAGLLQTYIRYYL